MEPDFGILVAWSPAIKMPSGILGKRPFFGQIMARRLLEPDFRTLVAWSPAIKNAFWDPWETAFFGPNHGQEPFWGHHEDLSACGTKGVRHAATE